MSHQGYPPAGGAGYPPAGAAPGYQSGGDPGYKPAGGPGYPPADGPGYPPAGAGGPGYPPAGGPGYPPAGAGAPGNPPAGAANPGYPPEDGADSASAPPVEKMDDIPGYNDINFQSDHLAPPPSYEEATAQPSRDATQIRQVPVVNETQARESLLEEVGKHCCWGKGPANDLEFTSLKSSSAFHYTLETFTEARSTKWKHEPYTGQPINGVGFGPAPMPWDVLMPSPQNFVDSVTKVEVPNTASVKPCHSCHGRGQNRCGFCHGRGNNDCHSCNRTGRRKVGDREENCSFCHGRGQRSCTSCHGSGFKKCGTCNGRGSLKCFIQLTVKWTNHKEDHISDLNNMPVELMRNVSGEIALQEENQRVWPVSHFPDQKVNRASNELVNKHSRAFPSERMLMQRHSIRIIPVTQACYSYKGKEGQFYVYGFEQKAHAPDYPSTCCGCCCVIM